MPSLRVLLLSETAGPGGSGHGGKLVSQVAIAVLLSWTSHRSFSVFLFFSKAQVQAFCAHLPCLRITYSNDHLSSSPSQMCSLGFQAIVSQCCPSGSWKSAFPPHFQGWGWGPVDYTLSSKGLKSKVPCRNLKSPLNDVMSIGVSL